MAPAPNAATNGKRPPILVPASSAISEQASTLQTGRNAYNAILKTAPPASGRRNAYFVKMGCS